MSTETKTQPGRPRGGFFIGPTGSHPGGLLADVSYELIGGTPEQAAEFEAAVAERARVLCGFAVTEGLSLDDAMECLQLFEACNTSAGQTLH